MKYFIVLLVLIGSLAATSDMTQAQRKRSSPFSEFHEKPELGPGKASPALHLKDIDDKEGDLRDYLGRWVFIEFGSYT